MKQKDNYPKNYRVRIKDTERFRIKDTENDYIVFPDNQSRFTFEEAEDIVAKEIHRARFEDKVRRCISIECVDCGRHIQVVVYVMPEGFSTVDMSDPDNHIIYVGEGFDTEDFISGYGLSNFQGDTVEIKYGDENDVTLTFEDGVVTIEFADGETEHIKMSKYLLFEGAVPDLLYEDLAFDICTIIDDHRYAVC